MNLYRFCSHEELQKLLRKETIHNSTDHFAGGNGGSTSRGFCMSEDKPEVAWKYLKGIVTPDVCIRLDIPKSLLKSSKGKYVGKTTQTPDGSTIISPAFKPEWCISELRPEWLKEIIPLESFVPDYELEAVRYYAKIKHSLPI